jgi:protein phosphatase
MDHQRSVRSVRIDLPEMALVILVGAAGSGKTTLAAAHFKPTQVVSSDFLRGLVADDEGDQSATAAAFDVLRLVVEHRLRRGRLTVVDAVNAQAAHRRPLLELATAHDVAAVAIVLDVAEAECVARDASRPGRRVGPAAIHAQWSQVHDSLPHLLTEGFDAVHVLGAEDAANASVRRAALPVNRRWERGPLDVVGTVSGGLGPLLVLLERLGYQVESDPDGEPSGAAHPSGRKLVFTGGVASVDQDVARVVRLVRAMFAAGTALGVRDSRDDTSLPSHLVLAGGRLVVAHAGIRREMIGRDSPRVRELCVAGEDGWAARYRGRALVVYGHPAVSSPLWLGRTVNLGGAADRLNALRFPELEVVSVTGVDVDQRCGNAVRPQDGIE